MAGGGECGQVFAKSGRNGAQHGQSAFCQHRIDKRRYTLRQLHVQNNVSTDVEQFQNDGVPPNAGFSFQHSTYIQRPPAHDFFHGNNVQHNGMQTIAQCVHGHGQGALFLCWLFVFDNIPFILIPIKQKAGIPYIAKTILDS